MAEGVYVQFVEGIKCCPKQDAQGKFGTFLTTSSAKQSGSKTIMCKSYS